MPDHQRAAGPRIGQRARQDLGVRHDMIAIGEGHGARIHQEADFRHFTPSAPLGQCGHGQDVHSGIGLCAPGDEFQGFGRVDGGCGVGARDDRGHPARRGRAARGGVGFLVPLARLADLDADIDDAGGEALAAAVDDAVRAFLGRDDCSVLNPQIARAVGTGVRIDQPGIGEMERGHGTPRRAVARFYGWDGGRSRGCVPARMRRP